MDADKAADSISIPHVSPIGVLDIYRQYYFDLGTFLAPSIDHVWIGPGSELSLVDSKSETRSLYREEEREREMNTELLREQKSSDELSQENEKTIASDMQSAVSAGGGVNFLVWHAQASAQLNYKSSRETSVRDARRRAVEQTTRATERIKERQRLLVRESVETRTESTRTHAIRNPTNRLISYELRPKAQVVGLQLQHVGTQLCWQFYIDEPGSDLGLAELIHAARPPQQEAPPEFTPPSYRPEVEEYSFDIPFKPTTPKYDDNGEYVDGKRGNQKIQSEFVFTATKPRDHYELDAVHQIDFQRTDPNHDRPRRWSLSYTVVDKPRGKFKVTLDRVNFDKQPAVRVRVRLMWKVSDGQLATARREFEQRVSDGKLERERDLYEFYVATLRERIQLARSIRARSARDLRSEERAALLRRTVATLFDVPTQYETIAGRIDRSRPAELHALSEHVRSLFDIDGMLYYLAPDWWNPQMEKSRGDITEARLRGGEGGAEDAPLELSPSDRVLFGGGHARRRNNYPITENSAPAPQGSSLGWLLQLDGDLRRNAMLNAAWAKVVIPIRRGKEMDAYDWLRTVGVEGVRGLDKEVDGDGSISVADAIRNFVSRLDERKRDERYLDEQRFYEFGYEEMQPRFPDPASLDPFARVASWREIVPTSQIVPVVYK
ncbi:MAG: hypothetical protein H6832_17335 [Planctomycetes bacterium]|nr:hypothetical protein [Planctomycetota bacterium]MCB9920168.1 hypothetical protein [Planctomycetota bacterium]